MSEEIRKHLQAMLVDQLSKDAAATGIPFDPEPGATELGGPEYGGDSYGISVWLQPGRGDGSKHSDETWHDVGYLAELEAGTTLPDQDAADVQRFPIEEISEAGVAAALERARNRPRNLVPKLRLDD